MPAIAGMLASAECIDVVADALRRHDVKAVVVDPVRFALYKSPSTLAYLLLGHGID